MPDCRKPLAVPRTGGDPAALAARIAHIAGKNPGSSRFDPGMSDEERNSEDNLVAVCASCHVKIDGQPNKYTVPTLRKIRERREAWVLCELGGRITRMGLVDIGAVALHVMASECDPSMPDVLLPPGKKIAKSLPSPRSERMTRHGMMGSGLVKKYINEPADIRLAGRLKTGLVAGMNGAAARACVGTTSSTPWSGSWAAPATLQGMRQAWRY